MPLSHFSKVFAVKDAKVSPLTADPSGGSPTYGASIDVPGIKSVTVSGSVETKTLRGDNTLLDADSVLTDVTVAFEYAKLSLDILAATLGGAVVDGGTTPDQTADWELTSESKPLPFKFEAVSASADTIGGDVLIALHKVILSSFPELGMAEEDYKTAPLEGNSMPLLSTGKWLTVSLRESVAPIGV